MNFSVGINLRNNAVNDWFNLRSSWFFFDVFFFGCPGGQSAVSFLWKDAAAFIWQVLWRQANTLRTYFFQKKGKKRQQIWCRYNVRAHNSFPLVITPCKPPSGTYSSPVSASRHPLLGFLFFLFLLKKYFQGKGTKGREKQTFFNPLIP